MAEYDYLAIKCKNAACDKIILIYCFGPHSRFVHHMVEGEDPLQVDCDACGTTHWYQRSDFFGMSGPEPPQNFRSHQKIQPKTSY